MAKYCVKAVWLEDRKHLTDRIYQHGLLSISLLFDYFSCWWCDPFFTPNLNFILIVTGLRTILQKTVVHGSFHGLSSFFQENGGMVARLMVAWLNWSSRCCVWTATSFTKVEIFVVIEYGETLSRTLRDEIAAQKFIS
jgi:hypothetical protein